MQLAKYDAACRALAAAVKVDEVLAIRDKAEALKAYAIQAKNRDMEADAWAIKERAEIRLGELIREQKETVGLSEGGRPPKTPSPREGVSKATLNDAGIDYKLSSRAQRKAALPRVERERLIAEGREAIIAASDKASASLIKRGTKAEQRAEREEALADRIKALPDRKYGVILADPEWRFEPYSRESGMDRAADNHYPTSELEAIKARNVASIAADDCVLFLWATVPMLLEALEVMAAWGFAYRSHCVWVKDRMGTGYWFRNSHELLLLGIKGSVPAPAAGTQYPSAIEAPVGEHSAKPEAFHLLIEHYFPTLPKIELNRRGQARPGWHSWGAEATP